MNPTTGLPIFDDMQIGFHGAARTVTGSKHLITLKSGRRILLDCGMYQGMGARARQLNQEWGFDPSSVDVLVLSHAHIDHSGLIPKLVHEGFHGPVYCTSPTRKLTELLLLDSAHIQQEEADFEYRKIRHFSQTSADENKPLYTVPDVAPAMALFHELPYDEWHPITEEAELLFTDAGHILGSACVHLRIRENNQTFHITFSGDVGRYRDVILRSPATFPQADYVIMESTYGNSLHEPASESADLLLHWIHHTCIEKKGKLIIAAFSLGRTQEILYYLNQLELERRLPALTYYLDSPLSIELTEIIKQYPEYFNPRVQKLLQQDNDPFLFNGLKYVKEVSDSKLLNFVREPCVIISASGMADAGRIKHHISNNIENSRNTILFTGYCEPESLGGRLLTYPKEVHIFGVPHEVHAEIAQLKSMSAHGDYEDLLQWLGCQDPRQVRQLFLVHGEYEVQLAFQQRLQQKGFPEVIIPDLHQSFYLSL
ncbi:MBL fold metallo-hydrolase RNA specificity domain-containing protein [Thermoflavifilum thermophilum]|uniref:Metallo-beta-lactamase family protein n=1 Tax=Thermoflavifilum thermophilum TaxID=1393122 RepID=A0A1I7NBY7_9BACT|nr:MBL fold metallo-hydrolase [Thermoflavifilum thermophilum]SFV32184.1 metallo-beta-lactamase family protein [Thermoflavifilum thermophilum]